MSDRPMTAQDVAHCIVDQCPNRVHALNLCQKHYKRWLKHGDVSIVVPGGRQKKVDPVDTFWKSFEMDDMYDCWLWTRHITSSGYGTISVDRKPVRAHRFSYEHFTGPIPANLEIDHLCHSYSSTCEGGRTCIHRRCVNPFHLEAVDARTNNLRSLGFGGVNAVKDYCPRGHPYDEANTVWISRANGSLYRRCRTCNIESCRDRRRRGARSS